MTDTKASNTRRPLARLLQFLLSAGKASLVASDAAPDGTLRLTAACGRSIAAQAATVAEAARAGLVQRSGVHIAATPEARTWLRRMLAGAEDFPAQHRITESAVADVDGSRQTVRINRTESPLAGLARMRDKAGEAYLPEGALAAGERLAADFQRGGLQPRVTMSWEPRLATRGRGEAGTGRDLSDTALAARARVAAAVDAMGPELSGVALDVCCFMKGLETVERERQWPARSAKLMLRTALMALARHYDPPRPERRPRSHAWGGDGYRPDAGGIHLSE